MIEGGVEKILRKLLVYCLCYGRKGSQQVCSLRACTHISTHAQKPPYSCLCTTYTCYIGP